MANEYLQRTPTSTGNRKVWTWAGWVKLNSLSTSFTSIMEAFTGSSDVYCTIALNSNSIILTQDNGAGGVMIITATPLHRDPSSWFHLLVSVDTTQTLAQNRVRIYVNGDEEVVTYTTTPSINFETHFNRTGGHRIGTRWNLSGYINAEYTDVFFIDGQALTPDVFGFYKQGKGYISVGSAQATDFRPGQWVPKTPRVIKTEIIRSGGFGVNGFYLPMNDSSNFGADFHTTPNSIITLKGEDLPQPRNGAPETTDAYVSQLRTDPYAANLVLAIPFISGGHSSGAGDYSADIKGSGTNKTVTLNGTFSVGECASYYGSALKGSSGARWVEVAANSDFANLYDVDHTIEFWYKNDAWNGGFLPHNDIMGLNVSGSTSVAWRITFTDKNANNQVEDGIELFGDITFSTGQQILNNDWNHCAVVQEGNNTTIYINGVAQVVGGKHGYSANKASTGPIIIGADPRVNPQDGSTYLFNGQLQDIRIYKGVAKYKGGFDVPRPYTPVGIATWRAVPDTTANNFATWNAVDRVITNGLTLSDGNLSITNGESYRAIRSTVGIPTTGKWYYEHRESTSRLSNVIGSVGIATNGHAWDQNSYYDSFSGFYWGSAGLQLSINGTGTGQWISSPGIGNGDILNIAYDANSRNLWLGINGTYYTRSGNTMTGNGNPSTGVNPTGTISTTYSNLGLFPFNNAYSTTSQTNFGQNPTFSGNTTAGTFTDTNGKGLFKYQPPSGFLALCEDNLPTPAISDPGEYFRSVLYNNATTVTGIGFTPDLIWHKSRTQTYSHYLYDSVRGVGAKGLNSNTTSVEGANDALGILSFDKDGFSFSSDAGLSQTNAVAWCWRAGAGTTSTNTDGSITSVVSVNQTAGFSIVSYRASNGSSIGHGLGKQPAFMIIKNRDATGDWFVYHKNGNAGSDMTSAQGLNLNNTDTTFTSGSNTFITAKNSSTFTVGTSALVQNGTDDLIAYCWAEIEGFSKAFSYTGNGNADGPFIYLGFKPAFVLIKSTTLSNGWNIVDNARDAVNSSYNNILFPDTSDIENSGANKYWDFLSNGIKARGVSGGMNGSGATYIGMAFAESPFQTANAK
jgi:hypothetical protein